MEYDEPSVLTEYVCRHCMPQMTMFEREGFKVVHAREKAEHAESARLHAMIMRRWVDQADPAVVAALSSALTRSVKPYETASYGIIQNWLIAALTASASRVRLEQSNAAGVFTIGMMRRRAFSGCHPERLTRSCMCAISLCTHAALDGEARGC